MVQNKAHLGDIVSPTVGELKGEHGTIVAVRMSDNRCQIRIAPEDDPTNYQDYQYAGDEIELIECKHQGVILSE